MFKLCVPKEYTFNMEVLLGKGRQCSARDVTVTYATVKDLTRRVKGHGYKLYMKNFFLLFTCFVT